MQNNRLLFLITEAEFLKNRHDFFLDILRANFIIDIKVILKSWEKEFFETPFNSKKYRATIFWGDIPDTKLVNLIKTANPVFCPMADCVRTKKLAWWYRIRRCKIICFSKTLSNFLNKHDFYLKNYEYWASLDEKQAKFPKILSETRALNIYVDSEITEKNQKTIDKLFKFQKYKIQECVKENTHLYLSLKENAGLDREFFRAQSLGIVPVANTNFGLGDYIEDKKTGYKYRADLPLYIDFRDLFEVRELMLKTIKINSVRAKVQRKNIIKFILQKNSSYNF